MAEFDITNDATGEVITVSSAVAPTAADIEAIFAAQSSTAPQPAQSVSAPSLLQRGGNLAMEGVASVNRAGASLIDIATSPAQYLLQKAGFDIPTLRSTVAEKGDFAGEGLATDVVAGGAELATLGLTGGATTRMLASSLDEIARFGESATQGVLRQLGRTTPAQDVIAGAASGMGGEISGDVAAGMFGEDSRNAGELTGQLLSPAVWTATTTAIRNLGNTVIKRTLDGGAPDSELLLGASRSLFAKLDEAGIVAGKADTARLTKELTDFMSVEGVDASLPQLRGRLNMLLNQAKTGSIDRSYLDRVHGRLRSIGGGDDLQAKLANEAAENLDNFIISLKPTNSKVLGNATVAEVTRDAREFWRRGSVTRVLDDVFKKTEITTEGARTDFRETLRRDLSKLLNNEKKMAFFTKREQDELRKVTKGGSFERTLEFFGILGIKSDDFVKTIIAGTVGGMAQGSVSPLAGASTIAGVSLLRASKEGAAILFQNNANYMRQVIKAGANGEDIVKAYMRNTPLLKRRPEELTRLLISNGADLAALRRRPVGSSTFVSDAVALGVIGEKIIREEEEQQQQTVTQ